MTGSPVLVLGGTGKTGKRVVRHLADRGARAIAASRSGERRFDWQDRSTWGPAVRGVESIYVVDSQTENAAELLSEFVRDAVAAGTRRLVLLSARAWEQADDDSVFAVESVVQDSGAGWTVLRPTWFAQNFSEDAFLSDAVVAGDVPLPTGDGLEPFIDAEDIAEVAAAVLTEDGHDGRTYALSGPRTLTFGDCVAEIASATGREISFRAVTEDDYAKHLLDRGFDADYAAFAAELLGSVAAGGGDYLSDGVQRVLGREPRSFADYARTTAATGAWTPAA
ncbi:NAD(P)H-binding protein [Actinokineospora sp. G85]|uniref:NAD(P)H-binding protein n=1 Tax=Actinokineospora sp. G85 TaxID=3406626 RepID=UPI003C73C2B0